MKPSNEPSPGEVSQHLRTQFLRRVAHDIASPAGITLTVLDELAAADQPRPDLMAMARRGLARLMRLSEHLALVADLEAGGWQPELASVDVHALTKQALDAARALDGRKDLTTAFHVPPGALVTTGDARLLLLVLREVIGNALKVATSRVEIAAATADGIITLRVDDDGPGFSPESAETLGQRFLERSSARGLGLSLSMGVEILRAHGGSLVLASSHLPPGRRGVPGGAVVLSLPAAPDVPPRR